MKDLEGRNVLVTGANSGLGMVTAQTLAGRGAHVVLACRSRAKAASVLATITQAGSSAELLELDLADLASVRAGAAAFLETRRPLHVLINNAGLGGQRGLTKDGFELHFGVNHLGHFLLTLLLMPALEAAGGGRVVNVTSLAHRRARGIDFAALRQKTTSFTGFYEYGVSKLCNVLFTRELARRYGDKGLVAVSVHPGMVATRVWRRVPWPVRPMMGAFMLTAEQGAETIVYCATEPDLENGAYFERSALARHGRLGNDPGLAAELWKSSLAWTGLS